jgi:hypothetical protein
MLREYFFRIASNNNDTDPLSLPDTIVVKLPPHQLLTTLQSVGPFFFLRITHGRFHLLVVHPDT